MTVVVDVIDHPLVATRLTDMRNQDTPRSLFRQALSQLSTLLIYEAMRNAPIEPVTVTTPVDETKGTALSSSPLLVPVLRAGLGMIESAQALLPESQVGFVGMARDEQTHLPDIYMNRLPDALEDVPVLVLDPMLATGGSLLHCIDLLTARGAVDITVCCVLAAPEGVEQVRNHGVPMRIVTASIDERLNESAFIVPGLGDAGDRQFGEI